MRVLVTGGRDYRDRAKVNEELSKLPISILIHGGASGADSAAADWAWDHHVHEAEVKPQWDNFGAAAGPRRNAAMLALKPDLLVAFPGGRGTADMIRQAKAAGIPVLQCS